MLGTRRQPIIYYTLYIIFKVSQWVIGEHVIDHPLVCLFGSHLPTRGTGGDNLDEGGTSVVEGVLKCLTDGSFCLADVGNGVDSLTGDVAGAFEVDGKVGDVERVSVQVCLTAVGAGGGLHAHEGGRCHLSACHAIDGVVDEDHGDVLATVEGMDGLACADASHVAVALIGEDEFVRPEAFDGRGTGRCTSVAGFNPIDIDVAIGEHGTADGADGDGVFFHAHLFDDFGNEFVYHAVAATGAVVHRRVVHQRRLAIYFVLRYNQFFVCHTSSSYFIQ